MALSRQARVAIDFFNKTYSEVGCKRKAIDILNQNGFLTRNGKKFTLESIRIASWHSGVIVESCKDFETVKISKEIHRRACIFSITHGINLSAEKFGINRETLRIRFKKRYPYLYKNKENINLIYRLMKTNECGYFEHMGCKFDLCDKEFFSSRTITNNGNGYFRAGKHYCHRIVARAKPGQTVDHINRDPSDNRLANLRVCSQKQNSKNRIAKGYFKITDRYLRKPYVVILEKRTYFETEQEAVDAYRQHHARVHGEFSPYFNSQEEKSVKNTSRD